MKREACRTCGRTNVDDDSSKCRQFQMPSGEYECPGDGPHDTDDEGLFLYSTAAEEARQEAFWGAMIEAARERGEI